MASPVLQFKRGALANLPGLRAGEPALTTDSFDLYVGIDSSTANNKFFGSHRYWTKGTATTGSGINLVEGTNNGTDYITLKSPNNLAGIVTYTLPGTQGSANSVLTNDGTGTLSWGSGSNNATFTGVSTFQGPVQLQSFLTAAGVSTFTNTTDNTLGNADTGAVQIDGGVGINKNLTVGANLNVQGYSEFVGVVTFRGGTINIGDSNTDNINIGGEFISNLTPNDDNTYDIGIGTQRWRNANFAGIVTATTFSGNASSADQVKTVTASNNAANYYVTFVDSHNGSATNETVYTDDGIYYNPGTNTFTTQYGYFTGNVTVDGTITGTASTATRAQSVDVVGVATNQNYYITLVDSSGNAKSLGVDAELLYNPNTNTFTVGTGVGITQFSASVSTGSSTSSVPTSSAVINYVGTQISNVDLTLGLNADSGGPSTVNTSQTLTISGTASQVQTAVSGQTVTISLPSTVVVGTAVSAPTIKTATIQHSNGTQAATIDTSGNITASQNLTVSGNLYVNGSTTQVNTSDLTVEDRTI